MRRKNNYMIKGGLAVAAIFTIADCIQQSNEHQQNSSQLNWDNLDKGRIFRKGILGGLAGGSLGYLKYRYDLFQESKFDFCSDAFLKQIIANEDIANSDEFQKKLRVINSDFKKKLWDMFKDCLVSYPVTSGSISKKTAIISDFDTDIILPFKKGICSLKEMYYYTYKELKSHFGNRARVIKKKRAISLVLNHEGEDFYFDVLPGREVGNYKKDKKLKLYRRPNYFWQEGGHFKIDSEQQKRLPANNDKIRKLIIILKRYFLDSGIYVPPIIIEQYISKLLFKESNNSMTGLFLNVVMRIAKKITQDTLIDPANSNNNLHSKINYEHRLSISNLLFSDLDKMIKNPRYIKEVFICRK